MTEDERLLAQHSTPTEQGLSLEEFRKQLGVVETETPQQHLQRKQETKVATYLDRTAHNYVEPEGYSYTSAKDAAAKAEDFWHQELKYTQLFKRGLSYLSKYRSTRSLTTSFTATQDKDARNTASEVISHLEDTGSPLLYRTEVANTQNKRFDSIDYSALQNRDVLECLNQLVDPVSTLKKMERLCGNQWEFLLKFQASALADVLKRIEQVPDEQVQKVSDTVHQHGFISINVHPEGGRSRNNIYHSDIDLIVEACERGGFTEEQIVQMQAMDKLLHLIPGRYKDVPLARVADEYHQVQQEILLAETIIRSYDEASVREMGPYGDLRHTIVRTLEPEKLKVLFEAVQGGSDSFGVEFVTLAEEHNVELDPNLFEDMSQRVVKLYGPRAGKFRGPRNAAPAAELKNDTSESLPTPRDHEMTRKRRETARQASGVIDPRVEFARVIASSRGEELTTENAIQYLYLDRVSQSAYDKISGLNNDERLHFYKSLVFSDKHSDSFWQQISDDLNSKTMDVEFAENMKSLLLQLLSDRIFSPNGQVDQALVVQAYQEDYCQDSRLLKYLPSEQQPYFTFLIGLPYELRPILKDHRSEFDQLVTNGKETPQFMKLLLENLNPGNTVPFVEFLTKERLALTYGTAVAEKLLGSLPKKTDERRNAFTHNEYDRTSGLMEYFLNDTSSIFSLNTDIPVLADFIVEFGLSRSTDIFRMFKLAKLYETGQLPELPEELKASGIESSGQLLREVKELKIAVMSTEQITGEKLKAFSPFQRELLKVVVGKTTHRFDFGRPDFDRIVADFIHSDEQGEIAPLPVGYTTERIEMTKVTIEFDPAPIEADFNVIRQEVLDSISNVNTSDDLTQELRTLVMGKVGAAQQALETIPVEKRSFAEKNIRELESILEKLVQPVSLDQLLVVLLNSNMGKAEQSKENSLKRRLILRKVFAKHFSAAFIQDVQMHLSGEITPTAILTVLNIVDELVKQHALNLGNDQQQGAQKYWASETVDALKGSKNGKKLYEVFGGVRDKLKTAVDEFVVKEESGKTTIDAIPGRDFTAEVSGYIADVCYTKEYPLLKDRPVVPYKFVLAGETAEQGELNGSVLVFEVTSDAGEECLLVRGFDYRNEEQVNIPMFIEKFLDQMADVAKKRGKKHVLIPGIGGAMSNYPMTINHLTRTYVSGKEPISLNEEFSFNDYDLTHHSHIARTIS